MEAKNTSLVPDTVMASFGWLIGQLTYEQINQDDPDRINEVLDLIMEAIELYAKEK